MQRAKSFLSRCRRFTLVLLAISFPLAVSAQEPLKEPRFYLERLIEYYRRIETISAEFSAESERVDKSGTVQKDDVLYTCRYYQKGKNYRQENHRADWRPGISDLAVFQDGTTKRLSRSVNDPPYLYITNRQGGMPHLAYQFFLYQKDFLEIVFQEPERFAGVEMSTPQLIEADGSRLVEVALDVGLAANGETGSLHMVLRLDPDRKYAPVYIAEDIVEENKTAHRTYEARNFIDAGHGYFAPAEIVKTTTRTENGERIKEYQTTVRVSKVEFNAPLDDSLFELVAEPGTHVSDQVAGLSYIAGERFDEVGKPLIPRDSHVEKANETPAAQPGAEPAPAPTPAIPTAFSRTRVVRVVAVVLLLLGGVVVWRLRGRKAQNPRETRP